MKVAIRRTWVLVVVFAASLAAGLTGWLIRAAMAEGIPPTEPLHYAGVIEEGGVPVNGARDLEVSLWTDATSADVSRRACLTRAASTLVTQGRFRVDLNDDCTQAVRRNPYLWVEVSVDGTPFAREKLGAVPYTVEADHAMNGVPVGAIIDWYPLDADSVVPERFQLCDGSEVTDFDSPYVGLRTPDLTDRFLMGVTADRVGDTGGTAAHDLAHWHSISGGTTSEPSVTGIAWDNMYGGGIAVNTNNVWHTHSFGGGTSWELSSIDNRPPFVGVLKIMRIR